MLTAYHPESNGMADKTISSINSNLFKIKIDDWLSVVRCLGMAVAVIRMVPSHTTRGSLFKLLYGQDGLVSDEISHEEFSTEADYNLAVKNHIGKVVETHNQAMSNNRHYCEKMKLAHSKKKVGKSLITNSNLENHVWMNVRQY